MASSHGWNGSYGIGIIGNNDYPDKQKMKVVFIALPGGKRHF